RRKGVDGFRVETAGSVKHPFSPSSDSLTDAPAVHKLCHNQAFCGLYDAQFLCLSTVQQQFHVFRSDDSAVEIIHSRNRGTVGHNVSLPRAWQGLDVYASHLKMLTPREHGTTCDSLPSVHFFYPAINF
ncbi:hypothetical protein AVEN_219842-1, partial [Araneus ventricosus]